MAHGFRRLEIAARFTQSPPAWVMWDGRALAARPGEPLAVTLLAHGIYILGRSSKYHRPRGMFCGAGSCGQCVMQVDGLPSTRACLARAVDRSVIRSQNTIGGAPYDLLGMVDRVFISGIDHHHLMTHSTWLNRLTVLITRELAGQGRLPTPPKTYVPPAMTREEHVAVAVVGAGPAGLAVAQITRNHGLNTAVFEAQASPIGEVRGDHRVVGFYDDRILLVRTRQGLLAVTADVIVLANGGYEQPPPCPGNDAPGVMGRKAALLALAHGVVPGWRVVLAAPEISDAAHHAANNQAITLLAEELSAAGVSIIASVGCSAPFAQMAGAGLACITSHAPHMNVCTEADETFPCDALIWCAPEVPAYELAAQMGVDTPFDPKVGGFVPSHDSQGATRRDGVFVAGKAAGFAAHASYEHGKLVGTTVARRMRLVSEGVLT